MSFSSQLKKELCANEILDREMLKAELYGMLLFGKTFAEDKIVFTTENGHRIILPPQNIGGDKISINRIGPDQYLVVTERPVYGSKPKYEIYTEEELVAKYGSNKKPQNSPPVLHTKA